MSANRPNQRTRHLELAAPPRTGGVEVEGPAPCTLLGLCHPLLGPRCAARGLSPHRLDQRKLFAQYRLNGQAFVYPKDLINPLKLNTWYRLTLRVDDLNGFRIELRERDGGSASATYTFAMPAGKTWRFHHWIYRNTAFLDNYVERTDSVLSTVFIGNYFEQDLAVTGGVRTYYYLGGKRVATGNATGLYFISGDQLGSTSLVTSLTGAVATQMLFKPYGLVRFWTGTLETDYRFTGQKQESNAALYDYGARFYDNSLNRWISPDSIVPDPLNPQSLNRYSYALNNPIRYNDPTGHCVPACLAVLAAPEVIGAGIGIAALSAALVVEHEVVVNHVDMGQAVQAGVDNFGTNTRREIGWLADRLRDAGGSGASGSSASGAAAGSPQFDPGQGGPNRDLRQEYEEKVRGLRQRAQDLRDAGKSTEDIARTLNAERRALGVEYKALTPPDALAKIYARNLAKYGDELGPTVEWLLDNGKTLEDIIDSAARPGGQDIIPNLGSP